VVDIGPLFALGQGLAAEAIRTSGTTVRFESRYSTTDQLTLETSTTATTLWEDVPAIVVPVVGRNTGQPLPGVEIRWTDWKIILLPDQPVPVEGQWMVVETSADPVLPGVSAKVLGHVTSSAGAVLTVFARPESS
jgi:hypothetical protein